MPDWVSTSTKAPAHLFGPAGVLAATNSRSSGEHDAAGTSGWSDRTTLSLLTLLLHQVVRKT